MTVILPFREENPRLRRRSSRSGTGQVYYGESLRRLLANDLPRSKRERDAGAEMLWLILAICIPACVLAAALIVSYAR